MNTDQVRRFFEDDKAARTSIGAWPRLFAICENDFAAECKVGRAVARYWLNRAVREGILTKKMGYSGPRGTRWRYELIGADEPVKEIENESE